MAGRVRSRNYPAFGLGEAIEKAEQLWKQENRAAVPSDVAVQAWGYSGLNGASMRTLGAMRQYGLLDAPSPKVVKLSPAALTIVLEPSDSVERAAAISEVASKPTMFNEIRSQYPEALPSDANIISWLVRSHGFSQGAAKNLIAAFRDTEALAGTGLNRDINSGAADSGRSGAPSRDTTPVDRGGRVNPSLKSYSYVLPGNTVATLTLEGDLNGEGAIQLLGDFLDLVKKGLSSQVQDLEKSKPTPDS